MKRIVLVLTIMAIAQAANAATEPLLLEPLSPTVLSTTPVVNSNSNNAGPQVSVQNGTYEATFTPVSKLDPNMVPQNAAAEGKPVPVKREPRVKIQTKQRSQGNSYWNPGGKGTKSYF